MKKKNAGVKVMVLLVAALAIMLGAMTAISKSVGKQEVIPPIATVAVEKNDIEEKLDASGTVESQTKKTFFSPVNAQIETLGMEMGDTVKKGAKLVTFNVENLEKDNTKAQMSVRSGELDIQDAVDSANQAAGKQASAAAKVGPLEQQVQDKQNEIDKLKTKIAKATTDAQKQAVADAKKQAAAAAAQEKAASEALKKAYEEEVNKYETKTLPDYQKELQAKSDALNTATVTYNQADAEYQQNFQLWSAETDTAVKTQLKADLDVAELDRSDAQIALRLAQEEYDTLKNNPPVKPAEGDYTQGIVESGTDDAGITAGITSGTTAGTGGASADATTVTADTTALQNKLERASSELAELQAELSQQKSMAEADVSGISGASLEKMNISSNMNELEAKSIAELIEEGKEGLSAEFDGIISACQVVEGSTVSQGMELFTLESIDDVSVEISVSKNDYDKIKEGQTATITIADNTYEGVVEKVNRIAVTNEKGTPMIGARVKISNPDENIFLGVDAKVTVNSAEAKAALCVPVEAVNVGNSGTFCYVVRDGVIVAQEVETGISSADYTEIKSGLAEGDQVILDIGSFEEGDKVTADQGTGAQDAASATDETAADGTAQE